MAEDTPNAAPGGPEQTPDPSPAQVPASSTPPAAEAVAPVEATSAQIEAPAAPADASLPTIDPAALVASVENLSADGLDQVSIDELLKQASFEDPAAMGGAVAAPDAADFKLPNFQQVMQDAQVSSIDLLRDVELNVKIELGRARMLVEDVLKLSEGSVVELDKLAGDPVDVFVNDRLVARGEVLVLNDNFCVRVNEIVAGVKEEGL